MTNKNNEKILKILIVIGIIAILVSVCMQYLKPLVAELLVQKKDQIRIRDISLINSAINKLQKINPYFFLGEPNKVYISIPSSQLNCESLELPSLPDAWEYRCKPETKYKKIDGNGWIPVDFTKLSDNSSFKLLPIDPVNSANGLSYYTYITGEGWALTSLLGSNKFIKQSAFNDEGTNPARFEIGSNLQLWAKASGLAAYWKFDEGEGITATDSSGNNNTGILTNGPNWVDGKLGKALDFDGVDDYISINDSLSLSLTTAVSISMWIYIDTLADKVLATKGLQDYEMRISSNKLEMWVNADGNNRNIAGGITLQMGQWYHLTDTYDGATIKSYVNGILDRQITYVASINDTGTNLWIGSYGGGGNFFDGKVDEVRIYNGALSAKEIRTIYNATK